MRGLYTCEDVHDIHTYFKVEIPSDRICGLQIIQAQSDQMRKLCSLALCIVKIIFIEN